MNAIFVYIVSNITIFEHLVDRATFFHMDWTTWTGILALIYGMFIGLLCGSFYSATSLRVLHYFYGRGRKNKNRWVEFFTSPSRCDTCHHPLGVLDLVPVLSYLFSNGKCRYCGAAYSWVIPVSELFSGITFVLLLLSGDSFLSALFGILFLGHLYITIVVDFHYFQIDHENTLFLYIWAILSVYFQTVMGITDINLHALSALVTLIVFLILYLGTGGNKLGMGDVLLAPALALYTGFPYALIVFTGGSALALAYWGIFLKDRNAPIPFGVFLSAGTYMAVYGKIVYKIYFNYWI